MPAGSRSSPLLASAKGSGKKGQARLVMLSSDATATLPLDLFCVQKLILKSSGLGRIRHVKLCWLSSNRSVRDGQLSQPGRKPGLPAPGPPWDDPVPTPASPTLSSPPCSLTCPSPGMLPSGRFLVCSDAFLASGPLHTLLLQSRRSLY